MNILLCEMFTEIMKIIENSSSLSAGIFPPLWLAYSQKWWVLFLFVAIGGISLCVNSYLFYWVGCSPHLLLQSSAEFTF